jgi:hypothetical protein
MWNCFSHTTPFLFLSSVMAVAFRVFWHASVEPDDEDLFTKLASFVVSLALSAIVLWLLQSSMAETVLAPCAS